jgi:hypothetical protein
MHSAQRLDARLTIAVSLRVVLGAYQAPLGVTLSSLTTGTSTLSSASGNFCPSRKTAGAFAVSGSQCITETGSPAGDLSTGAAKPAILASAFCIPTTTNSTIDLGGRSPRSGRNQPPRDRAGRSDPVNPDTTMRGS